MSPLDPRLAQLLPVFERRARRVAHCYRFALDVDDAVQLARVALWQCAMRAPELGIEALGAYAWVRALGSIVDVVRVSNGGRRHAQQHGAYGFDASTVLAARATGALPEVAFYNAESAEPICPRPLPDAFLSRERLRRARAAALRERLGRLNDRQLHVVALFLLGFPQHVIGSAVGVSAARVSQVLAWFAGRRVKRHRSPRCRIKQAA